MPPTSATDPCGKAGFTLLEMLLVLAILSLAIGLVLPGVAKQVAAADARTAVSDLQRRVSALRALAFSTQTTVVLQDRSSGRGEGGLALANGWRAASGLKIDAAGRCSAEPIELRKAGRDPVRLRRLVDACHYAPM